MQHYVYVDNLRDLAHLANPTPVGHLDAAPAGVRHVVAQPFAGLARYLKFCCHRISLQTTNHTSRVRPGPLGFSLLKRTLPTASNLPSAAAILSAGVLRPS